jgi:cytochrome b
MAVASQDASTAIAWDLPTRLFHWTLAALVLLAWVSFQYAEQIGDFRLRWHRANGVAIIVLLVWRVIWGFAGSSTARFATFLYSPLAAARYAGSLVAGRTRRFLGHNPLGAYMVVTLLVVALAQATLGLFTVEHNDIAAGPLYRLVSEEATKLASRWHRLAFYYVLLPAIGLHVTAIILYKVLKAEPLIGAMLTGRKPVSPSQAGTGGALEDATTADIPPRPLARAALILAIASAVVLGPVYTISGRIY